MKKIFLCFLTGFVCLAMLFAGGGQQQSGGTSSREAQTTVTFWDENPGPSRTPYHEEIIKWYHESQSKVKVEYVAVPQAQFLDKLRVGIAADEVPDIAGMQNNWLSGLIVQNALLKLDDIWAAWPESRQFDPSTISNVRDYDINKNLYMLPSTANFSCFWYRVDRFNAAGIAPPKTWGEFFDTVAKLTNLSKNEYGFAIRGGDGSDQLQDLLFAYSGHKQYIDADGKAAFRDPLMVEFLTRYAGIYNKYTAAGDVNFNYQAMVAAFDSGAASIIQHNLGSLAEHQKALPEGSFGTFIYPASVQGYNTFIKSSYGGYVVLSKSKAQDAAIDYLKHRGSARVISFWNKTIGQYPTRIDVQNEEWVKNAAHLRDLVPVMQDPANIIIDTPEYLPEYQRIFTEIMEPGFQAVLLGRKTPKAFLDEWADALEQAYQRYLTATKK
jgi:multiple sugar transport system substrate-binding protein